VKRNPAATEWLHARGLTPETIAAFRLAEDGDMVLLPYLRDGELINIKRRSIVDKKRMLQEKDAEPCLFGWHLIPANARKLAIAEGEFDAMALHQLGVPAVSVNAGAGNHQWIDSDWDRLQQFDELWLCFDADDAGQKGVREVANRLGIDRCKIVTFPGAKDANDYLLGGGDSNGAWAAIAAGVTLDPDELVNTSVYDDEVIREFFPVDGAPTDPCLWIGQDHDEVRFRPGEVSLWTGHNGHGKSVALSLVQLGLMDKGERFCVFSGEMHPRRLLTRMYRQACGMNNPTMQYLKHVQRWVLLHCRAAL
jgi:twinkle protein